MHACMRNKGSRTSRGDTLFSYANQSDRSQPARSEEGIRPKASCQQGHWCITGMHHHSMAVRAHVGAGCPKALPPPPNNASAPWRPGPPVSAALQLGAPGPWRNGSGGATRGPTKRAASGTWNRALEPCRGSAPVAASGAPRRLPPQPADPKSLEPPVAPRRAARGAPWRSSTGCCDKRRRIKGPAVAALLGPASALVCDKARGPLGGRPVCCRGIPAGPCDRR